MRIRLTGRPTRSLWPLRVKEKRAGHARVVMAEIAGLGRVFLERPENETRLCESGDDLAEPPEALMLLLPRGTPGKLEMAPADVDNLPLLEIVLAPVHQTVDAFRRR